MNTLALQLANYLVSEKHVAQNMRAAEAAKHPDKDLSGADEMIRKLELWEKMVRELVE